MRTAARCGTAVVLATAAALLGGCGGGPVGGRATRTLTGMVSTWEGTGVTSATVSVGAVTASSLQNGLFTVAGVPDGVQTVRAEAVLNGHRYSGQTVINATDEARGRGFVIFVSDEQNQGSIAGQVRDGSGKGVPGAMVFIGGAYASEHAFADATGHFRVDGLEPSAQYFATASKPRLFNQTQYNIAVQSGQTTDLSFVLGAGSAPGPLPGQELAWYMCWTLPDTETRGDARSQRVYQALIRRLCRNRGLSAGTMIGGLASREASHRAAGGSLVEVYLAWPYDLRPELYGFAINRGLGPDALAQVAVVRDPLASSFFDVDASLAPGNTYYYTVQRLDTFLFPGSGIMGSPSPMIAVQPMKAFTGLQPAQNALVTGTPTFGWDAVDGAALYQVYVWDRFPDLPFSADPNGVPTIWPVGDVTSGETAVYAPATSITYGGPALQAGHTYYWMVMATDTACAYTVTAHTFSPIMRFTVQ